MHTDIYTTVHEDISFVRFVNKKGHYQLKKKNCPEVHPLDIIERELEEYSSKSTKSSDHLKAETVKDARLIWDILCKHGYEVDEDFNGEYAMPDTDGDAGQVLTLKSGAIIWSEEGNNMYHFTDDDMKKLRGDDDDDPF